MFHDTFTRILPPKITPLSCRLAKTRTHSKEPVSRRTPILPNKRTFHRALVYYYSVSHAVNVDKKIKKKSLSRQVSNAGIIKKPASFGKLPVKSNLRKCSCRPNAANTTNQKPLDLICSARKAILEPGPSIQSHSKLEYRHEKAQGFHADRIAGGYRDYRVVDGDIDAGPSPGQGAGQDGSLPEPSAAMVPMPGDVHLRS